MALIPKFASAVEGTTGRFPGVVGGLKCFVVGKREKRRGRGEEREKN
jgi:hypothetical protein